MNRKRHLQLAENVANLFPADRAELVEVLSVLTGYVESRVRRGDLTAPGEHAASARLLLHKIEA